jgi:hypothetical protein
MVDINQAFPSNFLKASDLKGPTRATIARVGYQVVRNENKLVAEFKNGVSKPLILNKTNSRTIAKSYGGETDRWVNRPVELFQAMVDFQGNPVEAVRVRVPRPAAAPQQDEDPPFDPDEI